MLGESHLTPKQRRAAEELAKGQVQQQTAASLVGVHDITVTRWMKQPAFLAYLEAEREAIRQAIRAEGIANKQNRIDALNRRWEKAHRVIDERAADERYVDVPGYTTGLLVHQYRGVGRGDDFQLVDEFAVDTGLLNELRQHEKQAAQELGQWDEGAGSTAAPQGLVIILDGRTTGEPAPRSLRAAWSRESTG